jgi:hypothetical protein
MPFDLDCRDADYRRDPNRPKRCEQPTEREVEAPAVRLVGPEREGFLADPAIGVARPITI